MGFRWYHGVPLSSKIKPRTVKGPFVGVYSEKKKCVIRLQQDEQQEGTGCDAPVKEEGGDRSALVRP
jgi:hypothetical protein